MNEIRMSNLPSTSRYAWERTLTERPKTTAHQFPEKKFKNPFFIRNNPHPNRVRHIKGLLGHPVCAVLGATQGENVPTRVGWLKRLELEKQVRISKRDEKFVPGIGIVRLNQPWVEELKIFTNNVGISSISKAPKSNQISFNSTKVVRPFNMTSPNPCPSTSESQRPLTRSVLSRQMSRQTSKQSHRSNSLKTMEENYVRNACKKMSPLLENGITNNDFLSTDNDISNYKDNETYVITLLSQILETNVLDDIKSWLLDAPSSEKETVLDMVRALMTTNRDFRDGMDDVYRTRQVDGELLVPLECKQNMLHHETSLDINEINDYFNKQKSKSNNLSERLLQNIEVDVKKSSTKASSRQKTSRQSLIEDVVPFFRENVPDEIEDIRTRLASRCSVNVFNASSARK